MTIYHRQMSANVFISYRHAQAEWVRNRLAPAVRASGATVILDVIDGKPGWSLDVQMKKWTDEATHVLAVLSPEYFQSDACRLEWSRAMARDPGFLNGGVLIPILREPVDPLPAELQGTTAPLYLDLTKDGRSKADAELEATWKKLLGAWDGDLGAPVTKWLDALRDIVRHMKDNKHVNLVAASPVKWRELIEEVNRQLLPDTMGVVNVADPTNWERVNFLENTLKALGINATLDRSGPLTDIIDFGNNLARNLSLRLAFQNFEKIKGKNGFNSDFFDALRYQAMDNKSIKLLIHSHVQFLNIMPRPRSPSIILTEYVKLP